MIHLCDDIYRSSEVRSFITVGVTLNFTNNSTSVPLFLLNR